MNDQMMQNGDGEEDSNERELWSGLGDIFAGDKEEGATSGFFQQNQTSMQ